MVDTVEAYGNQKMPRTLLTGFILVMVSFVVFFISGFGYNWQWWGLGLAITFFKWGAAGGLAGLLITYIGNYIAGVGQPPGAVYMKWGGYLAGLIVVGTATYFVIRAKTNPPIHDITTNTQNPPKFKALRSIRKKAPNEVKYPGGKTKRLQLAHYPDIQPYYLDMSVDQAFQQALRAARKMPWKIQAVDRNEHRIEATHQIMWFGFKDDVVIRVRHERSPPRARVDMRSASRIGKSDLGENARRIKRYMNTLEQVVEKTKSN